MSDLAAIILVLRADKDRFDGEAIRKQSAREDAVRERQCAVGPDDE